MVFAMIRGQSSCQTPRLYLRPASRYTTVEPATARMVCSLSARSAGNNAPPATGLGLRPTNRNGLFPAARILASSFPIGPPAPRIVVIVVSRPPDFPLPRLHG